MNKLYWFTGVFATVQFIAKLFEPKEKESKPVKASERHDDFSITQTRVGRDRIIRLRGRYDGIMRHLGVVLEGKPPVPPWLNIEALPEYYFGCPHCGTISMMGEELWMYHVIARSRCWLDNSTTYLAKCKKCKKFMKATVNHED